MPRQPDPRAAHLLAVYGGAARTLRQRVVSHLETTWRTLGSWRDADAARFTPLAVPVMNGAIRRQSAITAAYLANLARITGGSGQPVAVPALDDLRGVPMDDVYRRPFETTWTAVSKGVGWAAAAELGLQRLQSIASTDLQLARTHTAREVFSQDERVIGFMRVTSGACCELCDDASDNAYHSDDLMPIHNNCNCDVEPLYAAHDTADLSARQESWVLRDQGGGLGFGDLSTGEPEENTGARPVVEQHGELGPVLVVAGQHFTGPDDL